MDRKSYWDEQYFQYWKSRVDETKLESNQSEIIDGDIKTESDEIYEEVFKKHPFNSGSLLEVGCAWGRWFSVYKKYNLKISGIDISKVMIDNAKKNWANDLDIKDIIESEAEAIPFDDNIFDNITCLAVFDATFQAQALSEIIRVAKKGAKIFLTGKNDNYSDKDTLAFAAEVGARGKGHPNFFTDTKTMIKQIEKNGHTLLATYFFEFRGDFAQLKFTRKMPSNYYEYFIVFKKNSDKYSFTPFSNKYSKTYTRKAKESL